MFSELKNTQSDMKEKENISAPGQNVGKNAQHQTQGDEDQRRHMTYKGSVI